MVNPQLRTMYITKIITFQHPYIYPHEAVEFHETGVITIKKHAPKGSLRDVLNNAKVIPCQLIRDCNTEKNKSWFILLKKLFICYSIMQPTDQWYKKYFSSSMTFSGKKVPRKFELNDLRTIGRQLLEALKFLHDKGIGHGRNFLWLITFYNCNEDIEVLIM